MVFDPVHTMEFSDGFGGSKCGDNMRQPHTDDLQFTTRIFIRFPRWLLSSMIGIPAQSSCVHLLHETKVLFMPHDCLFGKALVTEKRAGRSSGRHSMFFNAFFTQEVS